MQPCVCYSIEWIAVMKIIGLIYNRWNEDGLSNRLLWRRILIKNSETIIYGLDLLKCRQEQSESYVNYCSVIFSISKVSKFRVKLKV